MMRFMTLLVLVGALFVIGCEEKKPATPPKTDDTKKVEDAVKDAATKTGDVIKDAATKTEDAVKDAATKTEDAVKDATK